MLNFQRKSHHSRGVNQKHCSNICSYKWDPPTKQLPSSCSKWATSLILSQKQAKRFPTLKFSILNGVK